MHLLSAVFSNKSERDRMWRFLENVDWTTWAASETATVCPAPLCGEQLGVKPAQARSMIGFAADIMPQRCVALCAWMAQRSKVRVHDWPVLRYDDEEWPLLVTEEGPTTDKDALVVDREGVLRSWLARALPQGPDDVAQTAFLRTLTEQWQAFVTPGATAKRPDRMAKS